MEMGAARRSSQSANLSLVRTQCWGPSGRFQKFSETPPPSVANSNILENVTGVGTYSEDARSAQFYPLDLGE